MRGLNRTIFILAIVCQIMIISFIYDIKLIISRGRKNPGIALREKVKEKFADNIKLNLNL